MKPSRADFTPAEWRVVQENRTPRQVQKYLRSLEYNREKNGESQRSFRQVIKLGSAHCLEAALSAAVILEQHGYPTWLMSLESIDHLDHVIFVFKDGDKWGSVARSRDAGLHGRKPVFRTARDLAMSYFDPYVDYSGRIIGYAVVDLEEMGNYDWRFNTRNLWKLEQFLIHYPHTRISSSDKRYDQLLKRYKKFKAENPDKQATYYKNKNTWL